MKSNVVNVKIDQIKICVKFESQWNTVTSSVVRIMIGLAKCVLSRVFETCEREAEWRVDSRLD